MTQEEIDAIPDEVWVEAHDTVWPNSSQWLRRDKIWEAKGSNACCACARLLMQLRAKDAEIAALKGDDPDLLAARKIAADYWREKGRSTFAAGIEAGKHNDGYPVQLTLRGIKHGREQSQ